MELMDVVSHEWTHLMSSSELNWSSGSEAQALNEGISDIFGNYVQSYISGEAYEWELGEDEHTDRSMSDPPAYNDDPDEYDEIDWINGKSGNNSGPLRKMFYLLANGGTHPGTGISVTGIGVEDAIAIIYKVVNDHYITGTATYANMRTGCINAAKALFGDCSVQARQVARAFGAVGVGSATSNSSPCAYIYDVDPFFPCEEDINEFDIVFTAQYLPSTATVTWTVPSGWSYTLSGTGNSVCTITHVIDATTNTIYARVTGTHGYSEDSYTYDFQDCYEEGCPPLCRFMSENPDIEGTYYVYPNPANDILRIESTNSKSYANCVILNSSGIPVKEISCRAQLTYLDIKDLPTGFYIVLISYDEKYESFNLAIQ